MEPDGERYKGFRRINTERGNVEISVEHSWRIFFTESLNGLVFLCPSLEPDPEPEPEPEPESNIKDINRLLCINKRFQSLFRLQATTRHTMRWEGYKDQTFNLSPFEVYRAINIAGDGTSVVPVDIIIKR